MSMGRKKGGRLAVALSASGAVACLAATTFLVPAFAAKVDTAFKRAPVVFFEQFTPAGVDSRLAEKFAQRRKASGVADFPFTPAGVGQKGTTLTVAARRLSPAVKGNKAISVRESITAIEAGQGINRLKKTEFRLTSAKGWQGFDLVPDSPRAVRAPLVTELGESSFRLDKGPKNKPSRFKTDIAVNSESSTTPAVRGNAAPEDYKLDVGGSFKISRKVDVTAGVRYQSERDRIAPANNDRQDSEAVYVGTKIRF